MTLTVRNRLFFLFFLVSSAICIFNLSQFAMAALNSQLVMPPHNLIRIWKWLPSQEFFQHSYYASIAGIVIFHLYVPCISIFLYIHFEKTQALELIYFLGFLIGCFLEVFRIIIPTQNLWDSYNPEVSLISRMVIAGRALAPMSLLFAELFNDTENRQNVERNFIILLLLATTAGILFPLQTLHITSLFTIDWGFKQMFLLLRVLFCLCTLAILAYNGITGNSSDIRHQTIGYGVLVAGYFLLCMGDNYIAVIVGALFLVAGTIYYLHALHRMYLWK